MAITGKNEKFDSFLKRTLDAKAYQQVKISEPCILQSKKQNYLYRFTFITDDALYFTENPPKSISFSLPFGCLRDVQLIHDSASFLQKELRDITQHILIKSVPSDPTSSSLNESHNRGNSKALPRNTIWRNLVSTFNNSQVSRRTGHSYDNPTDVNGERTLNGEEETECGFETYNSASCKGATEVIDNPDAKNNSYLADDAMSVSSFNDTSAAGKQSSSSQKWAVEDPFRIEILESDKSLASDIHIYVLNETSAFFTMLRTVWKAYLLSSTNELDCADDQKQLSVKVPKPIFCKSVLDELRNDIIASSRLSVATEQLYRYFLEFKSVIRDNLNSKVYFWKDRELLTVTLNYFTKFSTSKNQQHLSRSDEIECMILICETLAEMFKQTEALPACHDALQVFRSGFHENLVSSLLREPSVANVMLLDEEMQSLLREYALVASEVLYELIIAAERVSWIRQNRSNIIFTTSFLFTLINSEASLLSFLKRVVKSCVHIWIESDKRNDSFLSSLPRSSSVHGRPEHHVVPLTPQEVVKIYQSFVVIHRCFVKCKNVKDGIRHSFTEEFRYYIRPEIVEFKIPALYPAAGITRNIIAGVASLVLEGGASTSTG